MFGSSIHITERFHITMASNKRLFPAPGASFFFDQLEAPKPIGQLRLHLGVAIPPDTIPMAQRVEAIRLRRPDFPSAHHHCFDVQALNLTPGVAVTVEGKITHRGYNKQRPHLCF